MKLFHTPKQILLALVVGALCLSTSVWAANSKGGGKPSKGAVAGASTKTSFNRESIGPVSGVKPAVRQRAYKVIDGLGKPGGARSMRLRSHEYKNDGRNGTVVLPKLSPKGDPIKYTTTYMREQRPGQTKFNARVVTSTDGSAWISKHYGQDGGRVARLQ